MSTTEQEDPELRDLIIKALENNGVLGKIRAQLRASTFLALDQQDDPKVILPINNSAIQKFVSTRQGLLAVSLVQELLSHFEMQYSLSVFKPESSSGVAYNPISRQELHTELGLSEKECSGPIIETLIQKYLSNSNSLPKNSDATFISSGNNIVNVETKNDAENDYEEDFQSSTTSPEPKNPDETKAAGNSEASQVEEEVDVSASDLLTSQGSNVDNDTLDLSVSRSSLGVDYVEKL